MDFSIIFASYPDCWKEAQLAEEHGFANAWFYDTQLHYSDVYACMALAADRTSRIQLGTQVSIPSLRIAPTTATAIATINALAPGRVVLGIGVGGFSVRRSMGLKPLRVARVKEYVRQVRGLLAGEDVLYREGKEERWIRLLHPDQGYINLQDRIPIYIAANGPKMLEATGELGDGWVTAMPGMATTEQQVAAVRKGYAVIEAAAQRAGRTLTDFYTGISTTGCVLVEGESPMAARVKARVGPFAMIAAHAQWEAEYGVQDRDGVAGEFSRHTGSSEDYHAYIEEQAALRGSPADRRYLDVHTGHLVFLKPGEERFLTEEMVLSTMTGGAGEIIERVRAWEAAGVSDVGLQVMGDTGREMIEEFSREVIAKY